MTHKQGAAVGAVRTQLSTNRAVGSLDCMHCKSCRCWCVQFAYNRQFGGGSCTANPTGLAAGCAATRGTRIPLIPALNCNSTAGNTSNNKHNHNGLVVLMLPGGVVTYSAHSRGVTRKHTDGAERLARRQSGAAGAVLAQLHGNGSAGSLEYMHCNSCCCWRV